MATLELTEDQLMTLRAAWQYFVDDDNSTEALAEALDISNEERGMDEDGDFKEGKDESDDLVEKRIAEVTQVLMA